MSVGKDLEIKTHYRYPSGQVFAIVFLSQIIIPKTTLEKCQDLMKLIFVGF